MLCDHALWLCSSWFTQVRDQLIRAWADSFIHRKPFDDIDVQPMLKVCILSNPEWFDEFANMLKAP